MKLHIELNEQILDVLEKFQKKHDLSTHDLIASMAHVIGIISVIGGTIEKINNPIVEVNEHIDWLEDEVLRMIPLFIEEQKKAIKTKKRK